ncbi:glycosyltransferase family 4 protein [Candidatus Pseudothioglobus singularis]|nr:glycosyltransferase family 4 protein [Candidatus Pseudothioglobus singularis]
MIKILNIIPEDRISGPIVRATEIAKELLMHNYETVIVISSNQNNAFDYIKKNKVNVDWVKFGKTPNPKKVFLLIKWLIFLPRDVLNFIKLLRLHDPNLVHLNSAFFFAPAIASKILKIPIIWHINDTMSGPLLSKVLGFICSKVANLIIVAANAVGEHYGINRALRTTVYPPVNYHHFLTNSHRISSTTKISLIANWSFVKGIDVFLKSAAIINKSFVGQVEFHIAGAKLQSQKKYSESLDQLIIDLNLKDTVKIHGHIDNISLFLSNMDIHVLTSRSEACPITVLEGMAASLPIVATNVGGIDECIVPNSTEPCGIVVPVSNEIAIAEAIFKLIENKDLSHSMGLSGRKRIENVFSLELCTKKHIEAYSLILA